jgi:hypothetical protein
MVKLFVGIAAGFLLGTAGIVAIQAAPAPGFRTDRFVQMIERKISGSSHIQITPGVIVTDPDCGCTVKYLGTKIVGHVYWVGIDKLD